MRRNVLWIDCTAAALAGVVVLMLREWLSALQALPSPLLLFIGMANILYACYSFTLATRAYRSQSMIILLVAGNLAWAAVCIGLAMHFLASATVWGIAHLLGEALFVGSLAVVEWKWRAHLTTHHASAAA
jgi:hypothetical protein